MPSETLRTQCCIVGGGPAGMMLGWLLARSGIEVLVLEKHRDFLRDFRGDTIHPSTLEVIHELGALDEFLKRPHQEVRELRGEIGRFQVTLADFRHLPTRCRFIAFMPQWDFLEFVAENARRCPTFHLRMQAEAIDLIEQGGAVVGVRAETPDGALEVRSELTIGADGRGSTVRDRSGLEVNDLGAPIDVLWMRISRRPDDPDVPFGRIDRGHVLVLIYRGDYWQCGFVIPKGGFDEIRGSGLDALRSEIARIAPFLGDRVRELREWEDIRLLTVKVDRLRRWYRPGLLCIGDAAHAMSPVGGVGINLAIQDAVAAANILAPALQAGVLSTNHLRKVQRRRVVPTRLTQAFQIFLQEHVIRASLDGGERTRLPLALRLLERWPALRRIPARLIGLGFRPEHVKERSAG